jgi:hypothetical protein
MRMSQTLTSKSISIKNGIKSAALLFVLLTVHVKSYAQENIFSYTVAKPLKKSLAKKYPPQIVGHEAIFIHNKKPKISNQQYEVKFHTINLSNFKSYNVKLTCSNNIFEIIKTDLQFTAYSSNYLLIVANDFEQYRDTNYFNSLYIFKKISPHTYVNVDVIKNYQAYEGQIIELPDERLLFYKNYDFHPLDDSIPSRISIYDINKKTFIYDFIFEFEGLYLTNLVGNFIAKTHQNIFMLYPTKNIMIKYDFDLNLIDTILLPISRKHQAQYDYIDSLRTLMLPKKQFISETKKIDKTIERAESIFTLDSTNIAIIVKPNMIGDFSKRILYTFNTSTHCITYNGTLNYTQYKIGQPAKEPNLTHNDPSIKYVKDINQIVFFDDKSYLTNNKLYGDKRLHINLYSYVQKGQYDYTKSENDSINSAAIHSNFLLDLNDNKYQLDEFLKPKTAILVINNRNCEPCNKDAFNILKKQYKRFKKLAIIQSKSDKFWEANYSEQLKRNAKVKNVLFTNSYYYNGEDLLAIPSPYLITIDNAGKYCIVPILKK